MDLPSALANFSNLDKLDVREINDRLSVPQNEIVLENYIANKVSFPQSIPTTQEEMEIDLCILTQVVQLNVNFFLNQTLKKIIISQEFADFYKPQDKLIQAVCLGLPLHGQYGLILRTLEGPNLFGTVLALTKRKNQKVYLQINNSNYSHTTPSIKTYHLKSDVSQIHLDGLPYKIYFGPKIEPGSLGLIIVCTT